jgi:two-component system, NarL family, invasion response regulator UvrY
MRILISDDHAVVRKGLKEVIVREFPDTVLGEASSGSDVLAQIRAEDWNLVILDLSMPGHSGFDVLSILRESRPHLNVLVFSIYDEFQYAKRALAAGARGYLNKECTTEEIAKAIRKVVAGGIYVSESLAERLANDLMAPQNRPAHESLSHREFEILRLLATGKTVSEIAAERHLAVTTVSTYRTRILEKMQLASTAALIRYAIEHHLAD